MLRSLKHLSNVDLLYAVYRATAIFVVDFVVSQQPLLISSEPFLAWSFIYHTPTICVVISVVGFKSVSFSNYGPHRREVLLLYRTNCKGLIPTVLFAKQDILVIKAVIQTPFNHSEKIVSDSSYIISTSWHPYIIVLSGGTPGTRTQNRPVMSRELSPLS